MKSTLFIAAGHGGRDMGASAHGYYEANIMIRFVRTMHQEAIRRQYKLGLGGIVFLDESLDLLGQLGALKAWSPNVEDGDLAFDLHMDFKPGTSGGLMLVDETDLARNVGRRVQTLWTDATGIKNNGIHDAKTSAVAWRGFSDFGWTRPAWPAGIWELGCINSIKDIRKVLDPKNAALAMNMLHTEWRRHTADYGNLQA